MISTGQGFIGNNMFAYCLNNPVNNADPSGKYVDSPGWEYGMVFYEWITGEEHPAREAEQYEAERRAKRVQKFKDWTATCWDAYMDSVQLQQETQLQQALIINEFVADRFSTPQKAGNTCTLVGSGILLGVSVDAIGKAAMAGTALGGPIGGAIGSFLVFVGAIYYTMAEE